MFLLFPNFYFMISKAQFIDSFMHEMKIIQHLGTKVTAEMLSYQPSEKQRTTLELMQYLGHIFSSGVQMNISADSAKYMEYAQSAPTVTLENFGQVIADQAMFVQEKLNELSDEALQEKITIFGFEMTRAMHMMSLIKWAAAYKTQLFLYIKANGNHSIGTSNLWGGMDMPPQV